MNWKLPIIITCCLFCGLFISAKNQMKVKTSTIEFSVEDSKLTAINNVLNNNSWSAKNDSLFLIQSNMPESVYAAHLALRKNDENQVQLTLNITNTSEKAIEITPVFPNIKELYYPEGKSDELFYLYPKMGWSAHNAETEQDNVYSRWFPLQFIDVYDVSKGGIYVMTQDTSNYPKKYYFSKKNGNIDIRVTYQTKSLQPGETWELPPVVIGAHTGDWHDAFFSYKDWVKTWYKPMSPRKQWFQDVYNLRQVFLHNIFGGEGVWNPKTKKIDLVGRINKEKEIYGGIDYVHIFDWTNEPQDRIFNYQPWDYLGGKEELKEQIADLQSQGMSVGLYYQGYKIHKQSKLGLSEGESWRQIDNKGIAYDEKKSQYYYPCAYIKTWQYYLSDLTAKTTSLLNTNGVYIDVYGFGYQFGCYDPTHGHPVIKGPVKTNYQTIGEVDMLKAIRSKLPDSIVLYVEEMPTDVSTQYLDASYTYAVNKSKFNPAYNPSSVNLFRFVFPDFKLFELLQVDRAVGADTIGIKNVFFNGEGIWLNGPTNDYNWHPESVRKLIRKTHAILSQNKEPFKSNDAVPLVPTLSKEVYANYFPSERKNIWTLFNAGDNMHRGDVLVVKHIPGSFYFDAWNNKQLEVNVIGENAYVAIDIRSNDAGCLIQSLDPLSLDFPQDPAPLEYHKQVAVKMQSAKMKGEKISLSMVALTSGNVFIDWGDGDIKLYDVSRQLNRPTNISHELMSDSPEILIYTQNRNIVYLNCNDNKLTSLDVSYSPMLQYLRCYNNMLTEIDLSNNIDLLLLHCYNNNLTKLDVGKSLKLNDLQTGKNKISTLKLDNLLALKRLIANDNPLGHIDLSNNKLLTTLGLRNCALKELNVSNCYFITKIDVFNVGVNYVNQFSACELNKLYNSLPEIKGLEKGVVNLVYTHNSLQNMQVNGSRTSIAENKNWIISSYTGKVLSGSGEACK